jgi:polysaccharide biosynthesis protein PelD
VAASTKRWYRRVTSADFWALERHDRSPLGAWTEVFCIPLLAIALAWWWVPSDPMLVKSAFPWLWLAPVLVALRYGVMPGLVACIPLLGNWLLSEHFGVIGADFQRGYFFGGALLVLVCGEFSDVWRDRLARIDETNLYLTDRLSRLTKRHLLLNLSHDKLEQEMLARPGSLRDALAQLRDIVIKGDATQALPGVDELLLLLTQYVNIESAEVHLLRDGGRGLMLGERVSRIGDPAALKADDELLAEAIKQGTLVHIADNEVSFERESNQLVVAPIQASDGTMMGVVAVSRLPFFSLNVENLQMLSVILGYYADNLHSGPLVSGLLKRLPDMPVMFAQEMARMLTLQTKYSLTSQIVMMRFEQGEVGEEIRNHFLRIKRGLDVYWQTEVHGQPAIAILMPFATSSARDGFLIRIERWLASQFKGDFDSLGIHVLTLNFARTDVVDNLARSFDK